MIRWAVLMCSCVFLFGCGSGGDNKVGGLTLTTTTEARDGGVFVVNASAVYTNPNKTDLVGTGITFDTSPSGIITGFPQTISTNTSGNAGIVFALDQQDAAFSFAVVARTGDLEDTEVVTVPALTALTVTPVSVSFVGTDPVGSVRTLTVTGGTPPYTAFSSLPSVIGAGVSGPTVTLTKLQAITPGNAVITVIDSNNRSATASVIF